MTDFRTAVHHISTRIIREEQVLLTRLLRLVLEEDRPLRQRSVSDILLDAYSRRVRRQMLLEHARLPTIN